MLKDTLQRGNLNLPTACHKKGTNSSGEKGKMMTEEEVVDSIYRQIDSIYADTKRLTSGNLVHSLPCLLHDILAVRSNITFLISKNTDLSIKKLDKLVRQNHNKPT